MNIIEFKAVQTSFGPMSLEISKETSFSFYGPAKIGKTSLLLLAGGISKPSEGQVEICEIDSRNQPRKVRAITGFCALKEVTPLYDSLSAKENLEFQARICKVKGISGAVAKQLGEYNLRQKAESKVFELDALESLRLGLAMATIHNPKILLIDEPEFRLSTEQKKIIPVYIQKLISEGYTVVYTTCDRELAQAADNMYDLTVRGGREYVNFTGSFNGNEKNSA